MDAMGVSQFRKELRYDLRAVFTDRTSPICGLDYPADKSMEIISKLHHTCARADTVLREAPCFLSAALISYAYPYASLPVPARASLMPETAPEALGAGVAVAVARSESTFKQISA